MEARAWGWPSLLLAPQEKGLPGAAGMFSEAAGVQTSLQPPRKDPAHRPGPSGLAGARSISRRHQCSPRPRADGLRGLSRCPFVRRAEAGRLSVEGHTGGRSEPWPSISFPENLRPRGIGEHPLEGTRPVRWWLPTGPPPLPSTQAAPRLQPLSLTEGTSTGRGTRWRRRPRDTAGGAHGTEGRGFRYRTSQARLVWPSS